MLPCFLRSEDQQRGASPWHGVGGPLAVEDLRDHNHLSAAFIEAGVSLGLPRNDDFNGASQEGVGFYQVTQRAGRRCSAAVAYLRPVMERANLTVKTGALAERILIEGGRAVGVAWRADGVRRSARCEGEVLVCAGAINSPQLLMLSGVGPADHLRSLGVDVRVHLPAVGEHLQDHLDVCTLYRSTRRDTYDFNALQQARVGVEYLLRRRGPGVSNIAEAGGFACSSLAPPGRPDIQFHFVPAQLDDHGRNRLPGHGFTLHACGLRPRSRGRIRLRSANPGDPPLIHANYLHQPPDLAVLLEALRLSREILHAAPLDPFRGCEVFPGERLISDAQLTEFIRRKAETIYHPAGSCRMGPGEDAVLDAMLRVHGVQGLRVADASIMPTLVSGNTNAPTIMIGEKAAQLILGSMYGAALDSGRRSTLESKGRE